MAYSKVERRLHDDERFRRWTRDVRQMWQYLLTTKHGNRLGLFVLDPLYAVADLSAPDDRWTEDRFFAALEVLAAEERLTYDVDTRLVLLFNHLEHNTPENPNVVKGALPELAELPFSEAIFTRFVQAVGEHCRTVTERGDPFAQLWINAVEDRIRKAAPNGTGNPSGNGLGNGMPNPEPEPEPKPEPYPLTVRRGETPREAADDGRTDPLAEMKADVNDYAAGITDPVKRRTFNSAAREIVTGDDVSAWHDHTGTPVPWPDRPRHLRMALGKLERGESDTLRGALRYVIPRQTDPTPRTTSGELTEWRRTTAPPAAPVPPPALTAEERDAAAAEAEAPERAARAAEDAQIAAWEAEHELDAARIRRETREEAAAMPGGHLETVRDGIARVRYRQRVLALIEEDRHVA